MKKEKCQPQKGTLATAVAAGLLTSTLAAVPASRAGLAVQVAGIVKEFASHTSASVAAAGVQAEASLQLAAAPKWKDWIRKAPQANSVLEQTLAAAPAQHQVALAYQEAGGSRAVVDFLTSATRG